MTRRASDAVADHGTFLIGRSIGALRAGHTRLDVLVTLLQATDA